MIPSLKDMLFNFFDDEILLRYFGPNKRLGQVRFMLYIACATWLLLVIGGILLGSSGGILGAISIALAFTLLLVIYANEDTYLISAGMFLWGASIAITYFAWANGGLWDEALFAYPCILTMAIIFNMQTIFILILLFNILSIFFFAEMHAAGILGADKISPDKAYARAINCAILMLIFSLCLQVIYADFRALLNRLVGEGDKAKKVSREVIRLATTDHVTQLKNEQIFYRDFMELAARSGNQDRIVSISVFQLAENQISPLSLEDQVSEGLYQQLASRLLEFASDDLTIYFFRGGKFLILYQTDIYREVDRLLERILLAFSVPLKVAGYHLELKAFCGVSTCSAKNLVAAEEMVRQAVLALLKAKRSGELAPVFYASHMGIEVDQRRSLLLSLKGAIARDELVIHYQSKVDLNTGAITGAEALLRWYKPDMGRVAPDVFIPLAEESGEIVEIGEWVIRQACMACKQWHALGFKHLTVAVNISIYQFRKGSLPYFIFDCLDGVGLDPAALELEITESMLGEDMLSIQEQIQKISKFGVKFSIDDFGTGYSNLGYVSKFNASYLKIDKSFVSAMSISDQDLHIVKAIINLAQGLEMEVIAEGVETYDEMVTLQRLGCQYGQGFFWSRPISHEEFLQLLKAPLLAND